MRRDLDLIRELMLKLEAIPLGYRGAMTISPGNLAVAVEGRTEEEIGYHLDQILAAGLIDDYGHRPMLGIGFACLTPAGHEFVDSVRSVDAWATTKDRASKIGSFTLGFLTDLAKAWAKSEAAKLGWM